MTAPTTSSSTSVVPYLLDPLIDPLLAQMKWGGAVGTGTSLTFSFPWTSNPTATFAGYSGAAYSSLQEDTAAIHHGLNAVQTAAARSAFQQWASVANVTFTEVEDTATNVGDIRIAFTSARQAFFTTWGWAKYPNAYWPGGGDIWISTNVAAGKDQDWAVGSRNYSSLLHEVGHSLGLKHPFEGTPTLAAGYATDQYSAMSYAAAPNSLFVKVNRGLYGAVSWQSFEVQPETPMLLDIAAIQYVYGPNLGYRTGNDVYTFDPGTPFLRTIWDAGGSDTISIANFASGSTIDLRAGHFSRIAIASDSTAGITWAVAPPTATYDGTDNLAIAYGVTIENAVGGAGDDVLRGNEAANSLDGGPGNDALEGGAGNDFFDRDVAHRGGADVFQGGTGDDTFFLTPGDVVIERPGEGVDTVWVGFSASAAENVENLFAAGPEGLSLAGNSLDNLLRGGAGNDTLSGGAGQDTVLYDGPTSAYVITGTNTGYTIASRTGDTDALAGIEYAQFADQRVPLLHLGAPVDMAFAPPTAGVPGGGLSAVAVTFGDEVQRGSGTIVLKTAAGAVVGSYDAASSQHLRIDGSTLTVQPAGGLVPDTDYVMVIAAGALRDSAGISYAGGASFRFTTAAAGPALVGSGSADHLVGTAAADSLHGGNGNDVLEGLGGDDELDGGPGLDTVLYRGSMVSYAIEATGAGFTVAGPDGFDILIGVERLQFSDFRVAFDTEGSGGMAYRLYRAAFDRAPDHGGLGFWMAALDRGASLALVAQQFLDSPEFGARRSGSGHDQYVTDLYDNVLHRTPDAAGLAFWVDHLTAATMTPAQTLVAFSESAENRAALIGVIEHGVVYTV